MDNVKSVYRAMEVRVLVKMCSSNIILLVTAERNVGNSL